MDTVAALAEIEALDGGLEQACSRLMSAAERGVELAVAPSPDIPAITEILSEIITLCSFRDLAGQRLSRLAGLIGGKAADVRPDAALLHGPADADGLDQAAADALFNDQ